LIDQQSRRYAETAIAALDEVIAAGPQAAHEDVASAVRCVAAMRNHMLAEVRNGDVSRTCLDRANTLLSLAYGAQAPLMGFHLRRIKQTRDGLAALLASG
jgi:hypothetical protein